MHVFIDSNIFLSFYHFTKDDLKELKKLVDLIKNQSITLYLPEQVINETRRNRATKINDTFENLKKSKFSVPLPVYCKGYEDYQLLIESIGKCEKHHKNMVMKIENDIDHHQLEADILINDIFDKAKLIKTTSEIISKAKKRRDLRNPPGKNNSLGDAINWESLLNLVPPNKKIFIITDDKDFYSSLNDNKPNEFLFEEWKVKKKYEPQFFRKLSSFFRSHIQDINLANEKEKDNLIEKLSASPTFSTTHSYIAALSKYNSFTINQATDLIVALLHNNQIYRIIGDDDVQEFYSKIYEDHNSNLLDYSEKIEKLLSLKEVP